MTTADATTRKDHPVLSVVAPAIDLPEDVTAVPEIPNHWNRKQQTDTKPKKASGERKPRKKQDRQYTPGHEPSTASTASTETGHRKSKKKIKQYTLTDKMSHNHQIDAVAAFPATYELAATIPPKEDGTPGCPRDFPAWALVIYSQAIAITGSASATEAFLDYPGVWERVVRHAAAHHQQDYATFLAAEMRKTHAPRRHHWDYFKEIHGDHLEEYGFTEAFRKAAAEQAVEQGLLDPNARFSAAHPDRRNTVTGDAKYYALPSDWTREYEVEDPNAEVPVLKIDPETGEPIKHRVAEQGRIGKQGGSAEGEYAYGALYGHLAVRDEDKHTRIVLDVEIVPPGMGEGGGDAGIALNMLRRLKKIAPGVQHSVYDGAVRGTHVNAALRAGINLTAPIHAKSSETGRSHVKAGRVEKQRYFETLTTKDGHGATKCEHRFDAIAGRVHEVHRPDVEGAPRTTALPYTVELAGQHTYRAYNLLRINCPHGEKTGRGGTRFHEHRVPITEQPGDRQREFNRAEQTRAVPPGTDAYDEMIGWRQDSESLHNTAQRAFYGGRLPAYKAGGQTLLMLSLALRENALSHYRHNRWNHTGGPPLPPPAPPPTDGDPPAEADDIAA